MKYSKNPSSSMDFEIGSSATQKSSTKFAKNQWSGHSNDGRLVQMPQQHNTRGNDGSCGHSGMSHAGNKPVTSAGGSGQKRGGGTAMPKTGRESFNMGRGPTRGNAQ